MRQQKRKMFPYTADAMPAISPIGSIAKALLFGSTARFIPISIATEIKNTIINGGSPKLIE
jgi:hypothetical protein